MDLMLEERRRSSPARPSRMLILSLVLTMIPAPSLSAFLSPRHPSAALHRTTRPLRRQQDDHEDVAKAIDRRRMLNTALIMGFFGTLNFAGDLAHGNSRPDDWFEPDVSTAIGEYELLQDFLEQFDSGSGKSFPRDNLLAEIILPVEYSFPPDAFARLDESDDGKFYGEPRIVHHIDQGARKALTDFYAEYLPVHEGIAYLDLCSSWVSHLPDNFKPKRAVGLGMNAYELEQNERLTEFVVQDLNKNPKLPFKDNSFDVVTNVVSVDYLVRPVEVFREMYRILKPGGCAVMSFSNRCFVSKAINLWLTTTNLQHCGIVGLYFKMTGFDNIQARDLSGWGTDPMYVVFAEKDASF
ncbi:unnamed protein product [Vitrella brassicaformis CCMP3155]|uniref:Methyltransferase type 11 domain-containing protein n=1 Tax=Vitrella brassicaformis (strain CCMP3155) TaxID=1169540 RepID=A0A0G4EFK7_VITBC|nr:unnamed protein product [Vitrella brassicaformis CCMP3155]|eukprot:CEL94286.1 unnamed protein product [Vitrella brassicaformis CCMP3155]